VDIGVFAEAVGLAGLAGVAVTIGAVVALDEGGVDLLTDQ